MRDALRAEWTKARTVPGPLTLGIALVVTFVAVSAATMAATSRPQGPVPVDVVQLSLSGVVLAQVLAVALAVHLVNVEHATGILQVSLVAVPRRWPVAAAKSVLIAGWTILVSVPSVVLALAVGRVLLPRGGFDPAHGYPLLSLADGPTLRAAVGAVVYLVLVALLSAGVALAVRDTSVAVTVILAVLFLFPVLIALVSDPQWQEWLSRIGPMPAGSALWGTLPGAVTAGEGAVTLVAWSVAAAATGLVALMRRGA